MATFPWNLGQSEGFHRIIVIFACSSDHWLAGRTHQGRGEMAEQRRDYLPLWTWTASCLLGPLMRSKHHPGLPVLPNELGTGTDQKPPLRTCSPREQNCLQTTRDKRLGA